ncbi:MAG: peptidoglycan-associated lipoprotein Pal [Bacteriovoracaceae bacterium]|nr:peptidoglycan-associated lipoprotein Pal [Bacteriovoracaceae bacterium]
MLRSSFLSLLATALVLVGCSSNKPKNNPDGLTANGGNNSGLTLELKGDSDSGTAGGLQTVYFGFDSSNLGSDAQTTLKANAEFLKTNASVDIQIEGHADERGGIQYNLALGERRAKAVRDYLVALGVAKKRVAIISYGKEKPVAFGHEEGAWSKNRRANFVVTAK